MLKTLVAGLFLLAPSLTNAAPSVLLTAFEKYPGDSAPNQSFAVVKLVRTILEAKGYHTRLCILPVVYDLAAQELLKCMNRMDSKPSIVISLGEYDINCTQLDLNQTTFNADDELVGDAIKNVRVKHMISDQWGNYGASKDFNLPFEQMLEALSSKEKERVRTGHGTGSYVCNNTSYWASHLLDPSIHYGFIHVPDKGC